MEAKDVVQWALTHTVQNQDTVILLHVTAASKSGKFRTFLRSSILVIKSHIFMGFDFFLCFQVVSQVGTLIKELTNIFAP